MGEGEACGVAVEGPMNTVLTVDVVKGVFSEWPRLENDDALMVAGSYRPLEDAYRIAHLQIIQWLAKDTGAGGQWRQGHLSVTAGIGPCLRLLLRLCCRGLSPHRRHREERG
jgi:acetamidase/formamidase